MRLKYLQQAWYGSVWGVDVVHAPFTTINQMASSYSPGNVTDGVDTRMELPYRVVSGHGGYSDWAGSWGAVISAEADHGWTWDKPHYYLPMWGDLRLSANAPGNLPALVDQAGGHAIRPEP